MNVETSPVFKTVQIDSLRESTTNPRRTFNASKLQELAESIKSKGVLQPLIVRPVDELTPYEIIAGARRYRASILADVAEVPCIVRELSDKDVLEFQMIENSQRDDVDPVEEADGYARLIEDYGHTVASLARRVGKSEHHIAARISLRDLCANAREALQAEVIKIGHAELLARLTVEQQEIVLDQFDLKDNDNDEPLQYTVADMRDYIQRRIYTSLVTAPFPLNKHGIVIGVPTCIECPKNSASQGALFSDMTQAWCTDKKCFEMKVDNWTLQQEAKLKDESTAFVKISEEWRGDRKTMALPTNAYKVVGSGDEGALLALVTDGREKGHTKYVVLTEEAPKFLEQCAKPEPVKAPEKTWLEQHAEREAKARKEGQLRSRLRLKVIRAIFEFEDGFPTAPKLRALIKNELYSAEGRALFIEVMGLDDKKFAKGIPDSYFEQLETPEDFLKAAIAADLCNDLISRGYDTDLIGTQKFFADLYDVDVKQLRKEAQAELKEEEKVAAAAEAAKAKKAPAKKAKAKK